MRTRLRARAYLASGLIAALAIGAVHGIAPAASAQSAAEPLLPNRMAFVTGNSDYRHASKLANPVNDSKAIATGFRDAGYQVVGPLLDLDRRAMQAAIADFALKAKEADVAVFYYAGHGVEFGGENYLLPVDAKIKKEKDSEKQAIKLGAVITAASKGRHLKLVILDACRDNPLAAVKAAHSVGRGLANIEPSAGVLVAFAARHGTTASDGAGDNSPFTTALLGQLARPGVDVIDLFTEVARTVREATKGAQEPYTYGAVEVSRDKRAALVAWRPERTSRPRPIFPHSQQRELTEAELEPMTCGELYLARNEIFARNGYCFTSERGRVNFGNQGCKTTREESSDTEMANVRAVLQYEQKRHCDK